jgi:hypothetical protein
MAPILSLSGSIIRVSGQISSALPVVCNKKLSLVSLVTEFICFLLDRGEGERVLR